jgi:hypothetical protein
MRNAVLHQYARLSLPAVCLAMLVSCVATRATEAHEATKSAMEISEPTIAATEISEVKLKEPLVTHIYTADPSAHVFESKLYTFRKGSRTAVLRRGLGPQI